MCWCEFTRREIEYINSEAAWTEEQSAVFQELVRGKYNDSGIILALHMDRNHFYRIKKQIKLKLIKILGAA